MLQKRFQVFKAFYFSGGKTGNEKNHVHLHNFILLRDDDNGRGTEC